MGSVVRTRKPKAPTIREAEWAPHKERIVQLHITGNLPLKDVRLIMQRERGFDAEIRQYRTRISKWKLDKNIKTKEMKAIVRRLQHRHLAEPDQPGLRFKVREQEVEPEKVERWMRAHNIDEDQPYAPSSVASTPAAVDYWTMSEQDTPTQSPDLAPVQSPLRRSFELILLATFIVVEEISESLFDMYSVSLANLILPACSLNREARTLVSNIKAGVTINAKSGFRSEMFIMRICIPPLHLVAEDSTDKVMAQNGSEGPTRTADCPEIFKVEARRRKLWFALTLLDENRPHRWDCCGCRWDNNFHLNAVCMECRHLLCNTCTVYECHPSFDDSSHAWGSIRSALEKSPNFPAHMFRN